MNLVNLTKASLLAISIVIASFAIIECGKAMSKPPIRTPQITINEAETLTILMQENNLQSVHILSRDEAGVLVVVGNDGEVYGIEL